MIKSRCKVPKTEAAEPGSAKWRCRTSLRCEMPMSMGKALTEPDHVPSSFQATVNYVGAPPASRRSWPGYALLPSPSLPICPSHPHHGRGGTLQSVLPPEYADASFHAGPEREGPLEPGSFFVLLTLFGKTTALRQGHAPNARLLGGLLAFAPSLPASAADL